MSRNRLIPPGSERYWFHDNKRILGFANYDVAVCAIDDRLQLFLLGGWHFELVECLLKIIHERVPFPGRDVQVLVRLTHRASRIFLRAARGPADHFGNEILEAGRRNLVMGFVHGGVRVQAGIIHDVVDKVIDHGRDAVNSTKALIEGRLGRL